MSPKRGGYLAEEAWQIDVRSRLRDLGMTEKDFAKKMRCAQSTMHDLLHVPGKASHLIPRINKFLGWEAPGVPRATTPPLPSPDAIEAGHMFDQLPEELRKAKILELRTIIAALKSSNEKPSND